MSKTVKSFLQSSKGISNKEVLFKKDSNFKTEISEKIQKKYALINKKWLDKDKRNLFKNDSCLCISHFHVKDKKIYLNFCEDTYSVRQGISETIGGLSLIEQDYFLSEINSGKNKLPISYKIQVGVITSDNKLILAKRSSKVSTNKGKYDIGISKGVKPEDFSSKVFQPLITAIRAVKEELGLSLDKKEIVSKEAFILKDFYLNREIFSLNFFCLIDLRQLKSDEYTAAHIIESAGRSKNSWELSKVVALDLTKVALNKYLKESSNKLTNYSLYHLKNLSFEVK